MSERRAWWPFSRNAVAKEEKPKRLPTNQKFNSVAGIPDLVRDTEKLRSDSKYDSEFDLFDNMLKLDPELNGAVRAVSLTGNNYEINYTKGKNASIRNAIKSLVEETLDFDDFLINAMRGLMVYGNDINKIVGKQGVGITDLQSLPVKQMTIVDERGELGSIFNADQDNPITNPLYYLLREMKMGHSILLNKGNERNAMWAAAKNMDIKIITRTEGDKIRVWRASA